MSAYTKFLRSVALPAGSMLAGYRDVMPYLRGLEESQWWSPEQIRALQDDKLRRLVSHVYRNVPFYTRWMNEHRLRPEDVRTVDDLHLLPVVDKHVLVANFPDDIRDHSLPQDKLIQAASSGSTGERLHYWTTKSQKARKWAGLFRWWELAGWQFGQPYATFQLAANQGLRGKPLLGSLEWLMLRHRWFPATGMTDDVLVGYAAQLRRDRPVLFRSYTSTVWYMAEAMLERGLNVPIPAILTTGETLGDYQRQVIGQAFAPGRVFNEYGGDGMQIACECEQHQGLHINAETLIVEVLRDGRPTREGELGEIVLTNLEATATPFIRYNIRDVGALNRKPCACGRGLPRLSSVEGRLTDLFITADGRWLTVHQFSAFFARQVPSVRAFQVIQRDVDDVLVKVVVTDDFNDDDRRRISDTFRGYLGYDNTFTIELVDQIPLTPSGKRRFFISEVTGRRRVTSDP